MPSQSTPCWALCLVLLALASLSHGQGTANFNCVAFNPATRTNCYPSSLNPANYYPASNSMYRDACHITNLPSNLQSTIDALFPETKHPDPATLRSDIYMYFTSNNANLSFAYASSITANTNSLGYAFYDSTQKKVITKYTVFPKLNNIRGEGCLVQGDVFRFGPFNANDMILFYLYRPDGLTFWSYIDPPQINPDTSVCSPNGCIHSAWAYIPDMDITLFGFEDGTLGDADYNDLVFFLTLQGNATFNQVPEYGGGTIKVCNFNTAVSSKSAALLDCTQWGLLESTTTQSCLTYMAIPTGWTWARDDATSRAAVASLASQWSYTSATCFLLAINDTAGIGVRADSSLCSSGDFKIQTIINGTTRCYNAQCTSRFVLKGANLGAGCTASRRCSPTNAGSLISSNPSSGSPATGVILYPTQYSVYLRASSGTFAVSTSLMLPGGSSTTQKVDVIVFADFSGVPSNKISTVIGSYTTMASSFPGENLDATFAFVQFTPSTTSSSYTLTSDYSFYKNPPALSTNIFPTNGNCPTTSTPARNIYAGVAEAMRNPVLNAGFRNDSFKIIWVHASCTADVTPSNAVYSATLDTGIVPVWSFAGSSTSSSTVPSQYSPTSPNASPLQVVYKSGDSWATPFATVTSSNSYPKGAGRMRNLPFQLLGIATGAGSNFVSGLSTTTNTQSSVSGTATLSYSLTWPSAVTDLTVASYAATVRVIGRGTTTFTISFNHPPSMPDVSYSLIGNQNQTITLTPTDPDGNYLNILVDTYPSSGTLYTSDGTTQITNAAPLPANVYTMLYVPNAYSSGADSVAVSVYDGCATDPATVSLTITYANTPPVAQDFSIDMFEDSTGDVGLIDFNGKFSDIDNTKGQNQQLTVRLVSNPSPNGRGALTNTVDNQAVSLGSVTGYKLRFNLTQPRSGYGTVTFSYQVSDNTNQGNSLSNIATVTINIKHVNHPPILTIPNTNYAVRLSGATDTPIDAFVTDYDDGDVVNLYAVATNVSQFAVAADRTLNAAAASSLPLQFYTSNVSSSGSNYPFNNLVWKAPSSTSYEMVTFRAQDQTGAWSNSVTIYMGIISSFPPVWTSRPLNDSYAPNSLNITQGDTLAGLYFSATDQDLGQYSSLKFALTAAPASGTVSVVPLAGGTPSPLATNGAIAANTNSDLVGLTATDSYFVLNYVPNPSFYGTDTFSFTVTDNEGRSARETATVVVNVARRLTAPSSGDVTIRTLEEQPGTGQISVGSTNDPTWPVYLRLESVNFEGLLLINGINWNVGDSTPETTDPFITVTTRSTLGIFSNPSTSPAGNFTYTVHENLSGLAGVRTFTGLIYVQHVNHPPTSSNQGNTIKKRSPLQVTIPALDPDADDTLDTLVAKFVSISASSKGKFYFDQAMTRELNSTTLDSPLVSRSFWYISISDFSSDNLPLATYRFIVIDKQGLGLQSQIYDGSITVTPAGDLPVAGALDAYTYQETPVPMVLAVGTSTETGQAPIVTIVTPPDEIKGTFATCNVDGTCTTPAAYPSVVTSSSGRVVFVPRNYDWGMNFTSFEFSLTDPGSGAVGTYTMRIHVLHVNKRPKVVPANFLTTAETTAGIIINESQWRSFDWLVTDVDSLPELLTSTVRASFYTSQGFKVFTCNYQVGQWNANDTTCDFNINTDTPLASRENFIKNARVTIPRFELMNNDCQTADILKARLGQASSNCEAHFKLVFAPTPLAYFTPYVSLTFSGFDDQQAESAAITALIYVKAVNTPPTIWAPATVLGGQGITNPFILDTSADSPTYNNPVSVDDVDSNGNIELLTISVNQGYSGNLVWPDTAPCQVDNENSQVWYCRDRIASFNLWLKDLRFEVTSADRADLTFTINDLGFSSDWKPISNLTSSTVTSIRLTIAVAAPKGNNSTLAIAVGVAAGVGLLLLGALGFFLRRAVTPPEDDYFAAATTPLSAAPMSPLYQQQNREHVSALYKGR